MHVVVVGGAGYVGSFVVEQLLGQGHEVTVADDLSRGNAWALPDGGRFVPADLLDGDSLDRVVRRGCEALVHCAGLALARESAREPLRYFRTNLAGTLNLLESMRRADVRRIVHLSSAAVYGDAGTEPVPETASLRPLSPYGASKGAAEELVRAEAEASGLGALSLRVFNVAGASGRLGEWHHPEGHLIPLALQVAAGIRPCITVHGTDRPTFDGTAVRDYVHVEDVARAAVLALDATAVPGYRVVNVGSGTGHSVRQVLGTARAVTGRTIPEVDGPPHPEDPAVLVAAPDAIRRELGWAPAWLSLGAIVESAWSWMRDHLPASEPAARAAAG